MSNQSNAVINKVVASMSDKLSSDQLIMLEASLIVSLRGMTVEQEHTELATVVQGWDWYLSRFRATKRLKNCSEGTLVQYEHALSKLRQYVSKNPQEMEENDIKYFLAMYGSQPSTLTKKLPSKTYLNNLKADINAFYSWMFEEGYISKNPCRNVPNIKAPKMIKHAYSGEDMEKMKAVAHNNLRDMALLYFLDATGCRISEAISVDKNQINWDRRSVIIYGMKSKTEREILFTEECAYWLKEYLRTRKDNDPALFVKMRKPNTRLTKTGAECIISELGKKIGVHAHCHRFRRTMITRCNKRGMSLQDIQRLAGHSNSNTTQIYIDMQKESLRASYERYN